MEWLRDEYLDYMTFRAAPRPMFVELFGPLIGLEEEWRAQGASEDEIDLSAFGFDRVRVHRVGINGGLLGGSEEHIEETSEHVITRDRYGRRMRLMKGVSTIAHPLDFPVSDFDSWLRLKPRYEFSEARFADGWAEAARDARARGALIVASIPGGFNEPRNLMGEEALCLACYDQPELVHDIMATLGETTRRVLERVAREAAVDQISVHEDLAGKSGSLVGPKQIAEFIRPHYRGAWEIAAASGARIFQQDSDGNVASVIDAFLDCGLTCMYPMEPAAGMDIVAVRRKYGSRLAMLGGIDKHVLRRSRQEIRAELDYKLQPMMRAGGVVFGLDHRIPNGTPLENYRYYVRTAREILGLEPNPEPGWMRMAF